MLDALATIPLLPLDLGYADGLRYFYGQTTLTAGDGVRVGIIDTGIANHPDLTIAGGSNLVRGEDPNDYGDSGAGHGTHVAGIIAGRGTAPNGVRGLAPSVSLYSYRVFGKGSEGASNFSIAKAVDAAVTAGCDLLNMSLGGGQPDSVVQAALKDARDAGCLPIAAAGNESRSPVSFPGNDSDAVAVSAMGRIGTFPVDTVPEGWIADPHGTDPNDFIAAFSNVGAQVKLTAPGVGIVSTFPNGYAALDGTSMACPAVVGFAAQMLAQNSAILHSVRDAARSQAIADALLQTAEKRGFGDRFEGFGLPTLSRIAGKP